MEIRVSRALLGPFEIVSSWPAASHILDDQLKSAPETYLLQWPIEPTSCDAEIGLVGRYVVDAVVKPRQHHVVVLQPHHPTR